MKTCILVLVLMTLALPLLGQSEGTPASQDAKATAGQSEGAVPPSSGSEASAERDVAAPIIGDAPRGTWGEKIRHTNFFLTNLRASTHIDDNALNDNNNRVTDAISTFEPNFAWRLARGHWGWTVDYSPQISYSINIPNYNTVAHRLNTGFEAMLTQRLTVRIRDAFVRTDDPFNRATGSDLVPAFGVLDRPNPSYFGPQTQYTSEEVGADLTYVAAAHTTVGVTGDYSILRYHDLLTSTLGSRDTNSVGGRVFVNRQFTARQSGGLSYGQQVITSRLTGRTVTHSILYFHQVKLLPNVSLSVFAGPQYIKTSNTVPVTIGSLTGFLKLLNSGWSWSAGGTMSWTGAHTGAAVNVARRVSDGGGVAGATRVVEVSGNVSRRLGSRWSSNFVVSFARNHSGALGPSSDTFTYVSAGASVTRVINSQLSVDVQYRREHQSQAQVFLPTTVLGDHDRVSIGLNYQLRSLGR